MSSMTLAEQVDYTTRALAVIAAARAASGLPHWVIIDEAHHVFPAEGSAAVELLRRDGQSLCLTTLTAAEIAAPVRARINTVAATDLEAFAAALHTLAIDGAATETSGRRADGALGQGEIALARIEGHIARPLRFRLGERRAHHRRHRRKYTEGELPPERSFYFRGPQARLNLRAVNLVRFRELAEGVDEETWAYHAARGDVAAWIRHEIKDPELADEITVLEATASGPAESRARALDALRRRYAV